MSVLTAGPYETNIIVCEFWELRDSTMSLHVNDPAAVKRLHDVWLEGAPSPDSVVKGYEYRGFDERKRQAHARVKRVVLPNALAQWIVEQSAARGMPMTPAQAYNIACGKVDYGQGAEG